MAGLHEIAVRIHNDSISVNNIGISLPGICIFIRIKRVFAIQARRVCIMPECIGRVKRVAGVQKQKILAFGRTESFVHGVIEPTVGFAENDGIRTHSPDYRHSVVFGGAVYNQVLEVAKCLAIQRLKRRPDDRRCIICDGDDRNQRRRIGNTRIPRHYLISILYFISVRYLIRVLYLIYGIGLVIIDVIHESNGVW